MRRRKYVDYVIFTNGEDSSTKRLYNKHSKKFLAKVVVFEDSASLIVNIPTKIKGIVRVIILKFILKKLQEHYITNNIFTQIKSVMIEDIVNNDNYYILITTDNKMINTMISGLEDYIKEFENRVYRGEA